jgi:lysozyme family protein
MHSCSYPATVWFSFTVQDVAMATFSLTPVLRAEYQQLFDTCNVRPDKAAEVDRYVSKAIAQKARYQTVAGTVNVPWQLIAALHLLEATQSFDAHLHNGDPLTARTRQVPAGYPRTGTPPFTWEFSAEDALRLERWDRWTDWSLPGTLFKLETFNGSGYRLYHPHVKSPYLWSYSQHYTRGKYAADGVWSETLVSRQCGTAVFLRRLAERAEFSAEPVADDTLARALERALGANAGLLVYSPNRVVPGALALQRFLNQFPNIYLKEDGKPGPRTSDAYRALFGTYLKGDPRA